MVSHPWVFGSLSPLTTWVHSTHWSTNRRNCRRRSGRGSVRNSHASIDGSLTAASDFVTIIGEKKTHLHLGLKSIIASIVGAHRLSDRHDTDHFYGCRVPLCAISNLITRLFRQSSISARPIHSLNDRFFDKMGVMKPSLELAFFNSPTHLSI